MGWANSHLHQFQIDGDPELLDDGFTDDDPFADSTTIKLSGIVPKSGKRLNFEYASDFGDGWRHEIVFEGCLRSEKGKRYPYLRLLRQEVEVLVSETGGRGQLQQKKLQKELADLKNEARKRNTRLKVIASRQAEIEKALSDSQ